MKSIFLSQAATGAAILSLVSILESNAQLQTTKMTIYSNGVFFHKLEGVVPVKNKVSTISMPENVISGTFWATTGKDQRITQIDVVSDTTKLAINARGFDELLKANPGKKVSFKVPDLDGKSMKMVSGTIAYYYVNENLLKLQIDGGGVSYFNLENIKELSFPNGNTEGLTRDSVSLTAKLKMQNDADKTQLTVVALQSGINWSPSYLVRLTSGSSARMIMKATVNNNATDIKNAELDLAVGNPQMSNLSIDPANQINRPIVNYRANRAGAMMKSARGGNYAPQVESMAMDAAGASFDNQATNYSTDVERSQDLYFYKTGRVNVKKGNNIVIPISTSELSFTHVYDCIIGDIYNVYSYRYVQNFEDNKYPVFHSLKLNNKGKNPITPAIVTVLDETDDFMAQDNLPYIPGNADFNVKLSQVKDVWVKNNETEVERLPKNYRVGKNFYDKLIIKGTISAQNYQDKALNLQLSKYIHGEVSKSDGGDIKKQAKYSQLNPETHIKWTISVEPGATNSVSYEYVVLIPAN